MALHYTALDEARLATLTILQQRMDVAGHGQKSALVSRAATELGFSPAKVWRLLQSLKGGTSRAKRSDAGTSAVTDGEVLAVAGIVSAAYRDNNKQLMSIKRAMTHAVANGWLSHDCSASTMARRMKALNVHPEQMERPTAHVNLYSLHPNEVHQVDPSLCVMYRMPDGRVGITRVIDELVYKNKPDTAEVINRREKLWRYVAWDHYSSSFFFRYYETPGESAEVLLTFLIEATRKKEGHLMHGWPKMYLLDKGSANTSARVKNLAGHLGVRIQTHKARNARAKGGVEGCNNLIECGFESSLVFAHIPTCEELNRRADEWQAVTNAMDICTRHGHTRWGVWQRIRPDQLKLSPPEDVLRRLANSAQVERVVNGDLSVAFNGKRYDVEHIESLSVGDTVRVAENAYLQGNVWVLSRDRSGVDRYHECSPIEKSEGGFWTNGVHIGEEFKAVRATPVDKARADLREMVWGERDENDATDARRKGRRAFDGKLDPFKATTDRLPSVPTFLPRAGTELEFVNPIEVHAKPLSLTDALFALRDRLGRPIERHETDAVRAWHPDGIAEDQLDSLLDRLNQLNQAATAPLPSTPRLVAVR